VGAVLSSLAWVSEVEFSWLEVAECGVQADVVVLVGKLLHFAPGNELPHRYRHPLSPYLLCALTPTKPAPPPPITSYLVRLGLGLSVA